MKPLTFKILRELADGEFHSGEKIAQTLGISRAGVWQALQGVEQAGLELYKVQGRGYRLSQPLEWLDAKTINTALGKRARHFRLEVLESAVSTNTVLLQRAVLDAPGGTVIAAEWQDQGRGRRGRPWHAGLGGALTFSLLWRFQQGAGFLSGLSLAVGVALLRALRKLGVDEVQLKWPNDILWRYRKLGGILIEMEGDMLGPSAAVIGIGLNLDLGENVKAKIDQAVVDLRTACGAPVSRNLAFATVLAELDQVLAQFARESFVPFREEWQQHHAHQNKSVTLQLPGGGTAHGKATGVAEDGALLLQSGRNVQRFFGGEVSLRAAGK